MPDIYSHKYIKIKFNSDNDLSLEKILNMQNVAVLIRFPFSKNHNQY